MNFMTHRDESAFPAKTILAGLDPGERFYNFLSIWFLSVTRSFAPLLIRRKLGFQLGSRVFRPFVFADGAKPVYAIRIGRHVSGMR